MRNAAQDALAKSVLSEWKWMGLETGGLPRLNPVHAQPRRLVGVAGEILRVSCTAVLHQDVNTSD